MGSLQTFFGNYYQYDALGNLILVQPMLGILHQVYFDAVALGII